VRRPRSLALLRYPPPGDRYAGCLSGRMLTDMARVAATYACVPGQCRFEGSALAPELVVDQGIRVWQEAVAGSLRG